MAEKEERSVARWDPFRELETLSPFGMLRNPRWSLLGRPFEDLLERPRALRELAPPVDISEAEDEYVVSAEVPGVKKEDITVELHEGVLTIRGEKKSEREEKKEKGRYLERSFGAFSRAFTLPADANPDRIEAKFKDGVLDVRIAKKPEAKAKAIAIKS